MTNRTKAIFSLSGIFLLGLLCGALAVGLIVRNRVQERSQLKNAVGFRDYFADELHLTEGQKDSLRAELERAYREMADIRSQVEIDYQEVFDTLAYRMGPLLTVAQRDALARQIDLLLPMRVKEGTLTASAPSIQEIDRKVASSHSASASSSASASRPNGRRRNSAKESAKEDAALPELSEQKILGEWGTASTGDSILTPEAREKQLSQVVARMKKKLALTDDQATRVEDLARKALQRNGWIRENFKDDRSVRKRRLRQSFRLLDRQVSKLLTEEQLRAYGGMEKEWKKVR